MAMLQKQLEQYLNYINNSKIISLGLKSWSHLAKLLPKKSSPIVVTVAGTNGKGSFVALLSQALSQQGVSYAAYTSPHIHDFKERLIVNDKQLSDANWLQAFSWLQNIADVKLSPFEFYTLSALYLAYQQDIAVLILEVGLGGRLDAVNVIDPDIAVITEIDFDHQERLGHSLAEIAYAKSGIMRAGKPVIFAGKNAQSEISTQAKTIGAKLFLPKQYSRSAWPIAVPYPSAAAALTICQLLPFSLDMTAAIENYALAGRFEIVKHRGYTLIFDVAHNPAAMQNLANNIKVAGFDKVGLWISLTNTKNIAGCIAGLRDRIALACISKHSRDQAHDCASVRDQMLRMAVPVLATDVPYENAYDVLANIAKAGCQVILIAGSFIHVGMVKKQLNID